MIKASGALFVLFIAFDFLPASAAEIRPFSTDGCTSYREGTQRDPSQWAHCCYEHDLQYWVGGTRDDRKQADREFLRCVADTGARLEAKIMYWAVRAGGRPFYPTPFRWGYGWPYPRGYKALSVSERDSVEAALHDLVKNKQNQYLHPASF